jgi:ankyrin repeat protein
MKAARIKYFLEIGSDPNIKDDDGFTAYHHCILSNTGDEYVYKSAKLLSDNKASLDIGKPLPRIFRIGDHQVVKGIPLFILLVWWYTPWKEHDVLSP